MMVQYIRYISLVFSVLLIQGFSCQEWNVNFTHDHICAVSGSSVVMPCSFTHPPNLRVTKLFWTIHPQPNIEPNNLLDNPNYQDRLLNSTYIGNICTLTLRKVKLADTGEYHPRIITENENQKWLQRPGLHLTVTDLSVWIPRPVTEGIDVKMICNMSCGSEGNPRVIWKKNGEVLPFQEGNDNDLILVNVNTGQEGDYSCTLKGFEEHSSPLVNLAIMFAPKNTSISVNPSHLVFEGDSVNFTCSSDANPPVENYTWFKVNESTPVGSGQQYSITNIRPEDGGQYYCEARNDIGAGNSLPVLITVLPENQTYVAFVIVGVIVAAIVGISCTLIHMIRGQTKEEFQISAGRRAAGSPSVEAAGAPEDDTQYSTIQPHSPGQTEDTQTQEEKEEEEEEEEEDEVQYVTVHIRRPKESSPPVQPEEAITTIYSTVPAIKEPKQNKQKKAISRMSVATEPL
ncbi:B-cell receptor CD22-like isoform X2 [Sardina pilchardus]|uniref:B-cell receptor CD22-like isoform X2 n=1 Tax=Sardina pilchardus TaxID=27697 RepID=UPI002E0E9023